MNDGDQQEEDDVCLVCANELDSWDLRFRPCPCNFKICRFCVNRLLEEQNSPHCPACRRPYNTEAFAFKPPLSNQQSKNTSKDPSTAPETIDLSLKLENMFVKKGYELSMVWNVIAKLQNFGVEPRLDDDYVTLLNDALVQMKSSVVDSSDSSPLMDSGPLAELSLDAIGASFDKGDEGLCVICISHQADTRLLDCGHIVLCRTCLAAFVKENSLCPTCRSPIRSITDVFGTDSSSVNVLWTAAPSAETTANSVQSSNPSEVGKKTRKKKKSKAKERKDVPGNSSKLDTSNSHDDASATHSADVGNSNPVQATTSGSVLSVTNFVQQPVAANPPSVLPASTASNTLKPPQPPGTAYPSGTADSVTGFDYPPSSSPQPPFGANVPSILSGNVDVSGSNHVTKSANPPSLDVPTCGSFISTPTTFSDSPLAFEFSPPLPSGSFSSVRTSSTTDHLVQDSLSSAFPENTIAQSSVPSAFPSDSFSSTFPENTIAQSSISSAFPSDSLPAASPTSSFAMNDATTSDHSLFSGYDLEAVNRVDQPSSTNPPPLSGFQPMIFSQEPSGYIQSSAQQSGFLLDLNRFYNPGHPSQPHNDRNSEWSHHDVSSSGETFNKNQPHLSSAQDSLLSKTASDSQVPLFGNQVGFQPVLSIPASSNLHQQQHGFQPVIPSSSEASMESSFSNLESQQSSFLTNARIVNHSGSSGGTSIIQPEGSSVHSNQGLVSELSSASPNPSDVPRSFSSLGPVAQSDGTAQRFDSLSTTISAIDDLSRECQMPSFFPSCSVTTLTESPVQATRILEICPLDHRFSMEQLLSRFSRHSSIGLCYQVFRRSVLSLVFDQVGATVAFQSLESGFFFHVGRQLRYVQESVLDSSDYKDAEPTGALFVANIHVEMLKLDAVVEMFACYAHIAYVDSSPVLEDGTCAIRIQLASLEHAMRVREVLQGKYGIRIFWLNPDLMNHSTYYFRYYPTTKLEC